MGKNFLQRNLFEDTIPHIKPLQDIEISFSTADLTKYCNYTLQDYICDIETQGLEITWANICEYVLTHGDTNGFLRLTNFGEMYEIGLAVQDKKLKKENGQYFTPDDVALVMSQWLDTVEGENVCDVACGTGKLVLTFLEYIGKERATRLIREGKLFLYDIDPVAIKICETSILLKYGRDLKDNLNAIARDFLSSDVKLPENCKVISNPPYAAIQAVGFDWNNTAVLRDSRELYSVFMEKIVRNSQAAVIITPYSFISGAKFHSLRKIIDQYSGEIYSFDNVPGTIFCGRKHGIFNTNTSNSVRAAITVVKKDSANGFRLTPLIRFKSSERNDLLKCEILEGFLSNSFQRITSETPMYYKCFKELQPLYDRIILKSEHHTFAEIVTKQGEFTISMPNTCRYFTSAFSGVMNRTGQITLHFDEETKFNYAFCLINSSFAYWHWRLFDGGITYPINLLLNMPIVYHLLSADDHSFFKRITAEMSGKANEFVIRKNNVGVQENIKYPREYRDQINQRILRILNIEIDNAVLDLIHSNMALKINV